jgi:hypothetical protein
MPRRRRYSTDTDEVQRQATARMRAANLPQVAAARREELERRARARLALGRGGEATRRRAGVPDRPERERVDLDTSGQPTPLQPQPGGVAPPAEGGQPPPLAPLPEDARRELVASGHITPPPVDDEEIGARRDAAFWLAVQRAHQAIKTGRRVGSRTRRRLASGGGGHQVAGGDLATIDAKLREQLLTAAPEELERLRGRIRERRYYGGRRAA